MRVLAGIAVFVLTGCPTALDDGPTVPTDTGVDPNPTDETGTPTDTDPGTTDSGTTDTEVPAKPPTLGVECLATANALRYLCTVTVDPPQPVQLTFARADGLSISRTVEGTESVGEHELGLFFMAQQQKYNVEVIATAWPDHGISTSFTTGTAPNLVKSSLDMTGTSTMNYIGTHSPCGNDAIGVVYDTNTGDLVWFQMFDQNGQFGSNDMLAFTDDHTVLGESEGSIIEIDLMGNDVVRLPDLSSDFGINNFGIFGNFHHDVWKQNGIYYAIYQENFGGFDVLDALVLFDGTGTELGRWHADEHLDLPNNWGGDFLHTNSVYVDDDGYIYLSFLGQAMLAKLDGDLSSPTFGDPIWLLDGSSGGDLTGTITTNFSAVTPKSFGDQHSFFVRTDGRLQILDNNNGRGLVISIDEKTSTATVDAGFDTLENVCSVQGTSRATQAGNPVVGCLGATVREYDIKTEAMVWQGTVDCNGATTSSSRFYPLDGW